MTLLRNITGQRFGRLVALRISHRDKYVHWLCRCDCGAEIAIRGTALTSGNSTQCVVCQAIAARGNQRARTHGQASTAEPERKKPSPAYESWRAMKARCLRPTTNRYDLWGGRGIKICDRWVHFENFLADMGERPRGTTLDRIDPDGDYEPSNCRWATPKQQRANNRQLTHQTTV